MDLRLSSLGGEGERGDMGSACLGVVGVVDVEGEDRAAVSVLTFGRIYFFL